MTARSRSRSSPRTGITWHTAEIRSSESGARRVPDSAYWREQIAHLGGELIGGERLRQEIVDPDFAEALHHLDVAVAAHGNDGSIGLNSPQLRRRFGTTQDRHRQIQQDQAYVISHAAEPLDGLFSILGQLYGIAGVLKH